MYDRHNLKSVQLSKINLCYIIFVKINRCLFKMDSTKTNPHG